MPQHKPGFFLPEAHRIALGDHAGYFHINKFGRNPVVNTTEEDLWEPGGLETMLTTPTVLYASCEDTNATQVIEVDGLDANWQIQRQFVTLETGQGQVAVPGTWLRLQRAFQVSPSPPPADDVWIAEADDLTLGVPDTASKVHAHIGYSAAVHTHQTEKAMYTIARGCQALCTGFEGGIETPSGASRTAQLGLEIANLATDNTLDTPTPLWAPFRRVAEMNFKSDGDTHEIERFDDSPILLPEGTMIHIRGVASADTELHGSFDLIMMPAPS
jgi:hypothetical protein